MTVPIRFIIKTGAHVRGFNRGDVLFLLGFTDIDEKVYTFDENDAKLKWHSRAKWSNNNFTPETHVIYKHIIKPDKFLFVIEDLLRYIENRDIIPL